MVLGVGKGVLFREVSSVQECPHRERERGSTEKEHTRRNSMSFCPTDYSVYYIIRHVLWAVCCNDMVS